MKKLISTASLLSTIILIGMPLTTFASPISFFDTASLGSKGSSVTSIQRFLYDQGYTKDIPTGIFSAKTAAALKSFQKDMEVPQTGSFESNTMAAANARLQTRELALIQDASLNARPSIALQGVTHSNNTAAAMNAVLGLATPARTVAWETSGFPAKLGVDINLLRKTSSSPSTYELVRQIAHNIPNTGSFEWSPKDNETGANLYLEIGCANAGTVTAGCVSTTQPVPVQ